MRKGVKGKKGEPTNSDDGELAVSKVEEMSVL